MSMSAGLSLMKKLGAKVASVSSPGLSLSAVKSAMRSEATSVSIYGAKVDSGDKAGWLVKQAVTGGNPIIVDPNYPSAEDKHYKGSFNNIQALRNKYSSSQLVDGDYAFVVSEVVCMQDTISNTFLTNQGTGNFTLGPVTSSTDDYVVLDYLQSTGTQYIDTGLKFQANDIIEIVFTPTTIENSIICGAYETDSKVCTFGLANSSGVLKFRGNSLTTQSTNNYTIGTKYTATNTHGQWSCSSTNIGNSFNSDINCNCTLFARKTTSQIDNFAKCKIHSYKHSRNGQVIMNLRPVNRLADLIRWKWNPHSNTWVCDNYVLQESMTFNSQAAADSYISSNNLKYTYPDGKVSTISSSIVEGYVPESSDNVNAMTTQLGPDCISKNAQCWAQTTPRPGTPIEFTQVIKQKIFSFG